MIIAEVKQKQRFSSRKTKLNPAGNSGLTLMELVIVLALMVIVISLVYSLFYFVDHSFQQGGDQFQLQSNLGPAADFITGELRNASEIAIVAVPFTPDASYQYIYVENKVLKYRNAGTVTEKSKNVITGTALFTARKDTATNKYYITLNLQGTKREEDFTLSTEILLNNVNSMTIPSTGNAIRYK